MIETTLETSHLLRSPRNAERLLLAIDQARRGEGLEMSVEDLRREVLGGEGLDRAAASRIEIRDHSSAV